MPNRKIDLYLDEELIKEGKIIAIHKNTSLSKIVNELLKEYIQKEKEKR